VPRAPSTTAPIAAAEQATLRALRRAGSARRAAGMRAYFKRDETVAFFGVAAPDLRRIARGIWADHRSSWDVTAATAYCDRLIRRPEFEAKAVGVLVLARWHRAFPSGLVRQVRGWLRDGHGASWAAVDLVAPSLLTPLISRYPALLARVTGWTTARSLWLRRAAAVALVPLARRGRALPETYRVAEALLGDERDLIHKAVGWLLREAGKTHAARLEAFLRRHGPAIPRTTLRYAIERFPPARRRRLLRETRPHSHPT
jgi:3-methyladenine DNA glycosylase AlkD